MMQECSKCGKPYEGDACPDCGKEQVESAQTEATEEVAVESVQPEATAETAVGEKAEGEQPAADKKAKGKEKSEKSIEPLSEETIQMALKGHRVTKIRRSIGWFAFVMIAIHVIGIAFGVSSMVRGTYYLTLVALFAGIVFPIALMFLPVTKWTPKKMIGKKKKKIARNNLRYGGILLSILWVVQLITMLAVNIKVVPEVVLPVPIIFSVMGLLGIVGIFFAVAALERPRREVIKYFYGAEVVVGGAEQLVAFDKSQNAEVRKHGSIAKSWKYVLGLQKGFVFLCVCVGLGVAGALTGVIGTEITSDPFRASNLEFITTTTEREVVERRLGSPTYSNGTTFVYCNDEYKEAYTKVQTLSARLVAANLTDKEEEELEEQLAAASKALAEVKTEKLIIGFGAIPASGTTERTGDAGRRVSYVDMDAVAKASVPSSGEEQEISTERVVTKAIIADSGKVVAGADYTNKRFYITRYYKDGSYTFKPYTVNAFINAGVDMDKAGTYDVDLGGLTVPFTVADEIDYETSTCAFNVKNSDGTLTLTWKRGTFDTELQITHLGADNKPTSYGSVLEYYADANVIIVESGVTAIPAGTFNDVYLDYVVIEPGVKNIGANNFGHNGSDDELPEKHPNDYNDKHIYAEPSGKFVPYTIYYHGTLTQWNTDLINSFGSNNKVCFFSETQPSQDDTFYWHYVDGVPTEWDLGTESDAE